MKLVALTLVGLAFALGGCGGSSNASSGSEHVSYGEAESAAKKWAEQNLPEGMTYSHVGTCGEHGSNAYCIVVFNNEAQPVYTYEDREVEIRRRPSGYLEVEDKGHVEN